MVKKFAGVLSGSVVLTAGVAMLAAPGQGGTDRPGQPTAGKVWVENRGRNEAVPVVLEGVATGPLGVQVVGTPTVTIAPATTVQARFVRQPWEYRTLSVQQGQDVVKLLAGAGTEGWEATGLQLPDQSGTVLLLKRPR